jgi:hypothetical protein
MFQFLVEKGPSLCDIVCARSDIVVGHGYNHFAVHC